VDARSTTTCSTPCNDGSTGSTVVVDGAPRGIQFKLAPLQDRVNRNLSGDPRDEPEHVASFSDPALGGHANIRGLTPAGKVFLWQLMRLGMLIDLDHMSAVTTDEALRIAEEYGYPVMSSHSSFRSLTVGREGPAIGRHTPLPNESSKSDVDTERIARLGGMLAPIANQSRIRLTDRTVPFVNAFDTTGTGRQGRDLHSRPARPPRAGDAVSHTSTAWAIAYLHAVDVMDDRGGVAIGSDFNGLAGQPGPRAGANPVRYTNGHGHTGSNTPLIPCCTGSRCFDINDDGQAHYGLLPDFLQDVRNHGVGPAELGTHHAIRRSIRRDVGASDRRGVGGAKAPTPENDDVAAHASGALLTATTKPKR
jgi:microsomal dipeptidase-like Zn-dependent dipeptidase